MSFQRNVSYNSQQQQPQSQGLNLNLTAQQSTHLLQQTQSQTTTQQQAYKQRQQLQQLNTGQLSNIPGNRGTQISRCSYKSFNLEDDLEFCPSNNSEQLLSSPNSTYSLLLPTTFQHRLSSRFVSGSTLKSASPYNTPTKLHGHSSQLQQQGSKISTGLHRAGTPNSYMSPTQHHATVQNPQVQQHFKIQEQQQSSGNLYGSPQIQGLLRKSDGSPIYTGTHQNQQHHLNNIPHHHQQQNQQQRRNW